MQMTSWFQMTARASSFEFIRKGQFAKAGEEEVGEVMQHCENGGPGSRLAHRVVGR